MKITCDRVLCHEDFVSGRDDWRLRDAKAHCPDCLWQLAQERESLLREAMPAIKVMRPNLAEKIERCLNS